MAEPREYPLSARIRARFYAGFLVLAGLVLCLAAAAVFALRLNLDVLSVVILVVVFLILLAGWAVNRRTVVLRLDDTGYQVRMVRGVGTASARWSQVTGLETVEVGGARCLVLSLRGGAQSTIPVDVLSGDPEELVRELRSRLAGAGPG